MNARKIMSIIDKLMGATKEDTKEAAWAFFNECDYKDLINTKICLVEMERRDSFLEYARSKGINPLGGAFTKNLMAQYFYI